MQLLIKVGSITNAQRGQRLLTKHGYSADITRLQNPAAEDGCGYALKVLSNDKAPVAILRKNGINVRGVEKL